ncbi:GntR family transcriptional regulator [Micromonospora sp. NPDC050397]|uniref:GntR family transcriptional regulator n=1 Tax=Micromonospora sp. NPDC050397 TaxID=3364279 RepID=UPI00384F6681
MVYPGQQPVGYADMAAELREQIRSGELRPGQRLPSERDLAETYGVSRLTASRAVAVLRNEGLIVSVRGYGYCVQTPPEVESVAAGSGDRVSTRPPTPEERAQYAVAAGYGVLVVTHADGLQDIYPGDRYEIVTEADSAHE